MVAGSTPRPAQRVVEQHPGAGAALAVDVAQLGAREVGEAGQSQRVAGCDQQTLVAVDQPHHGQLGSPSRRSGPGTAACTRRWPGRAGASPPGGTSPSRSATRPPSDPTFDDAKRDQRVGRAQAPRRRRRARGRASRSRRSCARCRRARAATRTWTRSPAWWPSTPAGTTSRPSARTSEVSTPAARGSGVATTSPPTRPSRYPHPVVRAERRRQLAGQSSGGRPDARAGRRLRAQPASVRRRCRTSARPRRGSRGLPGSGWPDRLRRCPARPGDPGRTATPCTASEPTVATTRAV